MNVYVIRYHQDDPKKCTARKMVSMGLAIDVKFPPRKSLILNPFSDKILHKGYKEKISGIVVLDLSWNKLKNNKTFTFNKSLNARLPLLFAGNPTNYAKPYILSSVEAVAASLYIFGFKSLSYKYLSIYKWGKTFLDLNMEILDEYAIAGTEEEIRKIEENLISKYR